MLRRVCSYTSFGLYRSFAAGSRFQNIQRYYCEPKEVSERATKMFESILASTPSNPDSALLKQNSYNMNLMLMSKKWIEIIYKLPLAAMMNGTFL